MLLLVKDEKISIFVSKEIFSNFYLHLSSALVSIWLTDVNKENLQNLIEEEIDLLDFISDIFSLNIIEIQNSLCKFLFNYALLPVIIVGMRRNKGIGIDRNLYILARFIEKIQFER